MANRFRPQARRRRDDRGASMIEVASLLVVAGIIVGTFAASSAAEDLHDGVRAAVCEVRGPGCGEETWTEHDRPEIPEEPDLATWGAGFGGPVLGSGDAAVAVAFMFEQIGKPYLWGGNGPHAWDCSGITHAAWLQAGVTVPRNTVAAWTSSMPKVSKDELQPGDLVYWHTIPSHPSPSHMGMYIGNGQVIHCGNPCKLGRVDDMPYIGANRPPQG